MKAHALLLSGLLAGCTVGPDFHTPAPPDTQTYTREAPPAATAAASGAAGAEQRFVAAKRATPEWWKAFGSDTLDRLVDAALRDSPTLASARAKLMEARENYHAQSGATRYPSVDAAVSATRQKVDPAAFGITGVPNPGPFTLFDASVSVSYTLDVFGGNRRALEATAAQVDYSAFQFEAARLSIAGNVVSAAIRRASLAQQIALTRRLLDAQERQLSIMEARFRAGGIAQIDLHAQRTLVAQTRASLPPLAAQLDAADHQLAILLGLAPSKADFDGLTLDTLHLPETVPLTLPSTLARERPDIRASEALLHQASANVGVATANLYPSFSLSAGAGTQRTNIHDIVNGLNVWNIGLNLTQPLFHGGELRAKQRAASAAYEAALADYQQTVLLALQQVADTLSALQNDARTLQARDDAAREARASLAATEARFTAGGVSRFDLIDSQRQALQTELDRTRAQADRMSDTTALFQSLGGGWDTSALSANP
jgi:NodT family efflux transporter outer membrane factor (OMF) lipoprotein